MPRHAGRYILQVHGLAKCTYVQYSVRTSVHGLDYSGQLELRNPEADHGRSVFRDWGNAVLFRV